jgi:hypothetical protein
MKSVLLMAGLAASAFTELAPKTLDEFLKLTTQTNYIQNGKFEQNYIGDGGWVITN